MQEVRRGGLTASAEQTKKQNAQPRMNADLRGYDSLILFKKITKLTKTDAYLWIFVTGSYMPCKFPGGVAFFWAWQLQRLQARTWTRAKTRKAMPLRFPSASQARQRSTISTNH